MKAVEANGVPGFRRLTFEESDAVRAAFHTMAAEGPVTLEDLLVALTVAAWEFDYESYNSAPFYRLISRLTQKES